MKTRAWPMALLVVTGFLASCAGTDERGDSADGDTHEGPTTLRLDMTNTTAEAKTRQTFVDLVVPDAWRTASEFEGGWSQPPDAPTLMLVASEYDDGGRTGTFEARREEGRISINLHPAYYDNNVTLSFTMATKTDGIGRWGHSTFAGYQEKGMVFVTLVNP